MPESSLAVMILVVFVMVVIVVVIARDWGAGDSEPALLRREAVLFYRLREALPLPAMAIGG